MKRVVITGFGIVCSLGNNKDEVKKALMSGQSGIIYCDEYAELGMRSQVHGAVNIDAKSIIDRKLYRFYGRCPPPMATLPCRRRSLIRDWKRKWSAANGPGCCLEPAALRLKNIVKAADTLRQRGVKRVGPYMVTKTMASTIPACVGTAFGIKGVSYSISFGLLYQRPLHRSWCGTDSAGEAGCRVRWRG